MKENKRKLNKLKVSIVLIIAILLITISVFGRYIYNGIRDMYLSSQNFFFTSNLLDVNGSEYNFNDWDGTQAYEIIFELYSYDNQLRKTDYDLKYNLTCSVSDIDNETKAKCAIGSVSGNTTANGIIYKTNGNKSEAKVYVMPLTDAETGENLLTVGDEVEVTITAKTDVPFAKEISAKYKIKVSEEKARFTILDVRNQDYLNLQLTNTETEASTITVKFDPELIRLDMNDTVYPLITSRKTTTISTKEYISEFTFSMPAQSAKNIRFYKVDPTEVYTYPKAGATSIIEVVTE